MFPELISMSSLRAGEHAVVLSFGGGRAERNRLASLGFTPGVEVDMTQNYRFGPLIVTVRGTRVALGRGEAAHILVRRRGA
ncbi:MAG: ferrous iron transport protein A [Anaerolineales bacterium]|nr:ferrous iron transport protein A [Anaerolineales bacterium]MCX7754785.1 ferrous iron transport protein A [Anaerolineales bacterium]MDW8279080.1 FeoA family protein [Anaerolineales bacterium]